MNVGCKRVGAEILSVNYIHKLLQPLVKWAFALSDSANSLNELFFVCKGEKHILTLIRFSATITVIALSTQATTN